MRKLTTEEFVIQARLVHGDKYDYSKVVYKDKKTKVCIICPIHGEFWQTPSNHLQKHGCPKCGRDNVIKSQLKTFAQFLTEAHYIHGDKYEYIEDSYIDRRTPMTIICPIHGLFKQIPSDHLNGKGCPSCAGVKKLTTEEFIAKARQVHGYKYDYSKVEYKGNKNKVCIICPVHGEFWQTPNAHLSGRGCVKCAGLEKRTTEQFISDARKIHGDFYDYSKVDYINCRTPICIICPIHGEFWQTPMNHLLGMGCQCCGREKTAIHQRISFMEFLEKANTIHCNKYRYPQTDIKRRTEKIKIICPIHGEFEQQISVHLNGHGCPKCAHELNADNNRYDTEEFIRMAIEIHGDFYDYSKVDYKDSKTKVCIICPIHGEFWQTPSSHLQGRGCPICKESRGEKYIRMWLDEHSIDFNREHCITPSKVLVGRNYFLIDYFLPTFNTFIEFHGRQHFEFCNFFHRSIEQFQDQQDRDQRLREHCKQHKIRLIEIPYTEIDNIDKILTRKLLKSNKIL